MVWSFPDLSERMKPSCPHIRHRKAFFYKNTHLSFTRHPGIAFRPKKNLLPPNSAIRLHSGSLAVIYNPVGFNDDRSKTVWPDQRCPVAFAISDDGGKTWPFRRIVEILIVRDLHHRNIAAVPGRIRKTDPVAKHPSAAGQHLNQDLAL